MVFRILVNDGMDKEGLEMFARQTGFSVTNEFREGQQLLDTIGDFDAFLVRSKTTVTREMIEAGVRDRLRMIGRGGVGVDNIDVDAATKYGIVVKNAPNGVTNSTAEHAFFLIGAVARKISSSNYALRNGVWKKKQFGGIELAGRTLGLMGCGRIGQAVAAKARGIGMEVIGYDANMDYVREKFPDSVVTYMTDMKQVLELSDVVSLHTGGKQTVISAAEIVKMKTGAILINASRGGNVDEEALYNALTTGKLYGAGLDTYKGEPKKEGQDVTESMRKLVGLDNVVMTPHLGASTKEGQKKTSIELARVTIDYFLYGDFENSFNTVKPSLEGKPHYTLCIHHGDNPNMFGKMALILGSHGVNIRQNPSQPFIGNGAVITNYVLHQPIDDATLGQLRQIPGVKRVLFSDPYQK